MPISEDEVADKFRDCAEFAGMPADRAERVIELVGLKGREHDPVKVYSHGMKQRLGIASCLLPRPGLIILDEPTDGLDPHGIKEVRDLIQRLAREEGLTVFLSSHLLGEVENLCNRIAILEQGTKILEGHLTELEREHRRWRIDAPQPERVQAFIQEKFQLNPVQRLSFLTHDESELHYELRNLESTTLNAALVNAGIEIRAISKEEGWLDRLFLDLTTSRESFFKTAADAESTKP